jgi:diguanylate cyclase (GGDEF)-like protein
MLFLRSMKTCFLLCFLILAAAPAWANPLLANPLVLDDAPYHEAAPHLHFLEDKHHRLGIAEISSPSGLQQFRSIDRVGGDANWGYSDDAIWLALPVAVPPGSPAEWLMEVGFSSLDRVEVYLPRPDGGFDMLMAGDLQPFSDRPFPHRNLVFPIRVNPGSSETIFLKVVSQGSVTVPVRLWQQEALHREDQSVYAKLFLYFGSLLALGIYNLLLYFSTRDKIFIAYVAFVSAMAVSQMSLNGVGNQFLWPDWPQWGNVAYATGTAATGLFGALFSRIFLDTRTHFPVIDRLLLLMAWVFACGVILPPWDYRFAGILITISGFAFSILATASGFYCLRHGHPGARLFLMAWLTLLAGVAIQSLRNFGWIPTNALTLHAMQIGSALEILLLSFALADRINIMRQEKELAKEEALKAKQEIVDALRQSEHKLERRVKERTHSIEEAHLKLLEKEAQLEHIALHDPLTGLANRLLLDETLSRAISRAQRDKATFALMGIDLDYFKEVNDHLGHAAGDQLLQIIAERIRSVIRATDTAARIGGDEFVIVLEQLRSVDDTFRVADKLIAAISEPVELSNGTGNVSASLGIAYYPQHGKNAFQLLKAADTAMYAAKNAGRNCWRQFDKGQE